MAIDAVRLYEKYRIDYRTSGPEVTQGWVNCACPFCSDDKHHLGYSPKLGLFSCWKCGGKSELRGVATLLNIPFSEAKKIIDEYYIAGSTKNEVKIRPNELKLPDNERRLLPSHKEYLIGRGFDADDLEKKYGLVSCKTDKNYKNRIIIPIYYKRELVSFHSRDVSGLSQIRAKACPSDEEIIPHKNTVYGFDRVRGNTVIVSEGAFDKWRWGDEGVATWGIKFTEHQVALLSCFKNVFIVFDSKIKDGEELEIIARKQAEELADRLSIWNNVWLISDLGCDPAELSQRRANRIKQGFFDLVRRGTN